jgi:hypothetical protein
MKHNYQTFDHYNIKELMRLGVKCNLIGIERYFHNPKGRILLIQVYDPHSMGGGIGFTAHVSNPKNDMLTDMVFVEERPWTDLCKPKHGLGYAGELDDYKLIAKFISDTCNLPDMILKEQ